MLAKATSLKTTVTSTSGQALPGQMSVKSVVQKVPKAHKDRKVPKALPVLMVHKVLKAPKAHKVHRVLKVTLVLLVQRDLKGRRDRRELPELLVPLEPPVLVLLPEVQQIKCWQKLLVPITILSGSLLRYTLVMCKVSRFRQLPQAALQLVTFGLI